MRRDQSLAIRFPQHDLAVAYFVGIYQATNAAVTVDGHSVQWLNGQRLPPTTAMMIRG